MSNFLKEIESDLRHIILAYPVYGGHPYYDMIGKVYEKVKANNVNLPEVKELTRVRNTTFNPSAEDELTCSICGNRIGNHLYSTKRCPK